MERMSNEGKPSLPWPGADDRATVAEMLQNADSQQWHECRVFMRRLIVAQARARNLPQDIHEDIIQEAMLRIRHSLCAFRYECTFKTWLFTLARHCTIDFHRKAIRTAHQMVSLEALREEEEQEDEIFNVTSFFSAEEDNILQETTREALQALGEWIFTHAKPERNQRIIDMVLLQDRSLEEAAKEVECSPAVASYVVRTAQEYVRKKLEHRRQRPRDQK
jgi:RNA polymerase sigma-70 factor (ECF subfamily)